MKDSTEEIHKHIAKIGKTLGFETEIDASILAIKGNYSPVYDVVWYLRLPRTHRPPVLDMIKGDEYASYFERFPVAAFEVEGSSTSSKNQVGNAANLHFSPSPFTFMVVDNSGAGKENDTYRRAIRINSTFNDFAGCQDRFVLDWSQLKNVRLPEFAAEDIAITLPTPLGGEAGTGGEIESAKIFRQLFVKSNTKGLTLMRNWKPDKIVWRENLLEKCRAGDEFTAFHLRQRYVPVPQQASKLASGKGKKLYLPRLDVVLGFNLPVSFGRFMKALARQIGDDIAHYPLLNSLKADGRIFMPLLGSEIETGVSKHLNGGIFNLSRFCFCGLLIAPDEAGRRLEFFKKNYGIRNVFHRPISS